MQAKYRLSRNDFARMRGFRRVHGTLFALSFGGIAERVAPGAACVISAKVIPRAAARNRLRRLCREVLSPLMPTLPPSQVVVFIAKKPAATSTAVACRAEITTLLHKAGITSQPFTG